MKHKIVIGAWSENGLPFSRKACEALAAIGVESAARHLQKYGGHTKPEWSEMSQDYVSHDRWADFDGEAIERHDPRLVKVVEDLGADACRYRATSFHFRIVEIESERYVIRKDKDHVERVVTPTTWTVIS